MDLCIVQPLSSGLYRRYRILTDSTHAQCKGSRTRGRCPITAGVESHHPLKLMKLYYMYLVCAIREPEKYIINIIPAFPRSIP